MRKKKLFFLLMLSINITGVQAQDAVLSTGGNASGSGGSASYSVGQAVYTFKTGSTGTSNDGVQQPYEFFITGIDKNKDISLTMTAFPNPANTTLNLKLENMDFGNLYMELFTVEGKVLLREKISNRLTTVPMQTFAVGTYFLKVYNNKSNLKSFTIIKN